MSAFEVVRRLYFINWNLKRTALPNYIRLPHKYKKQPWYIWFELELATSPQHHREGKHLQAKLFYFPHSFTTCIRWRMSYIMYPTLMKLGAHGKWESNMWGRGKVSVRGNRSGVKSKEESRRELGWRKEGVNGAEVWKLADRTGYAQTESQAQTWEHCLSIWNTSPVSLAIL